MPCKENQRTVPCVRRTDADWLRAAYDYTWEHSPDRSTKNGAVLVTPDYAVLYGCNRLPERVAVTPERLERPLKMIVTEHAERDVIFQAARKGIETTGATLYCPWFACPDCARAIILAGIRRVVGHRATYQRTPERWREPIAQGDQMLDEAGVVRDYVDGPVGNTYALLDGETWKP